MSDAAEHEHHEPPPPPPVPPEPAVAQPQPAAAPRLGGRSPVVVLSIVGLLLLFLGFVWLAIRLDAVEEKLSGLKLPDNSRLESRLAALERRPVPDLRALEARVAALEQRPAGAPADTSALEGRIAALEQRPTVAPVDPRVDALAARLDQMAGAANALAAEEVALRLAFPEAARQAEAASRVQASGQPLLERMWAEASALVTVKQGERVLSGPPAAPALERARVAVAAGDFAGAVKALDGLDPGAAQAMAAWKARAAKLVAARASLAKAGG